MATNTHGITITIAMNADTENKTRLVVVSSKLRFIRFSCFSVINYSQSIDIGRVKCVIPVIRLMVHNHDFW